MASDITLTASMRSNLVSLQSTADTMATTQTRLATGKKVNTALDNPASFFAAAGFNQRASLLNGLKDNISDGIQMVKAADAGVKALTSLIENLRGQLSQARSALSESTSASSLDTIATQYNVIIKQMNSISQTDSHYKGVNFLANNDITVNFNEEASTSLTLSGFDGSATATGGLAISGGSSTSTGAGTLTSGDMNTSVAIQAIEDTLNTALTTLQDESATLANNLSILNVRNAFITDMTNTLADGANKLVAADQNEEGANMLMLQTRSSLGTTSLSLASQAAQGVLRLF